MEIDPALSLSIGILEIVGKPRNAGNRHPGSRVQVGVAAAGIDGPVADTKVSNATWIVSADRNVACYIRHVIVDARIPFERDHRIEVADRRDRISDTPHPGCRESSHV